MLEGASGKLLGGQLIKNCLTFYKCCLQVSDEDCEDIPSEHCEAVNVKVARRKCGDQQESSHGH